MIPMFSICRDEPTSPYFSFRIYEGMHDIVFLLADLIVDEGKVWGKWNMPVLVTHATQ